MYIVMFIVAICSLLAGSFIVILGRDQGDTFAIVFGSLLLTFAAVILVLHP